MVRYAFSKVGMTSAFTQSGTAQGVTVLKMQPAKVLRHETLENGKVVVVVEYDTGHKNKLVRGWVVENPAEYEVGSPLKAPSLSVGQKLKITGFSKGRGFQDAMTRHGFGGGPASHGSRFHRSPGSVGMRAEPGRVMKGKKMPGQDGNVQVTLRNVQVAYWSHEESIMAIVGGVPGARGGMVFV
ncbi:MULTISPECIES: 50S ribosomal protein L3 [Silvanigrella]|jgi:large subunit ribosomal protein L3|uniref:Large ribosomal subunit protein uL3 n=2 Tax=Silvanigrella TaxID=2024975 RepID=A0A1L4D2S1_9BACT|nr:MULTISPECIES: 50S ribosomal protein L3 [Silvanigrella]APJ04496.1 50S ribosomal protein L3 [Silvanigrella aquatica]KAB8037609.1 50S ribosomal protein L3 [Silvanigrella paludirubra]